MKIIHHTFTSFSLIFLILFPQDSFCKENHVWNAAVRNGSSLNMACVATDESLTYYFGDEIPGCASINENAPSNGSLELELKTKDDCYMGSEKKQYIPDVNNISITCYIEDKLYNCNTSAVRVKTGSSFVWNCTDGNGSLVSESN